MTKTMTAAAALLLGVALAATAQAASTTPQSAAPATDTQQKAQTGTAAASQVTKQRTTRKLSKRMTTHRQVAAKHTGKKLTMAKLTRQGKLQRTARLHRRSLRGQEQSTAIGSSTMPSTSAPTLNTLPPATNAPMAGSGSSMLPQGQPNTLQSQPLNQNPTTTPPIR